MEKQTTNFRRNWSGLLIKTFLICVFAGMGLISYCQSNVRISYDYIKTLRIKSAQEFIFSSSESQFYLDIEGVTPENVFFSVERLPDSVSFSSSKKETLLANAAEGREKNGTRIILTFRFSEAGTYKLSNLYLKLGKYNAYYIPFESQVKVYMNPKTISPKVGIQFEKEEYNTKNHKVTVPLGEHIRFTVNLQYAVSLQNFRWALPQDSIFLEEKRYPVTENGAIGTAFSPDLIPIISFDWQPLVEGTYTLPQIIVTAATYNGSVVDLVPDDYKITVKKMASKNSEATVEDNYESSTEFDYAFFVPYSETIVEETVKVEIANIQEMLAARQKERHSVPFFTTARAERIELESSYGIKKSPSEPSEPLFFILLGITILVLAGAIVLLIFKKLHTAVFVFVVTVFLAFAVTVHGIRAFTPYALFIGGEVSPIPEDEIKSGVSVQPGSRVKVVKNAGEWVYIGYNDTFGWVKEDSLYMLN